MAKMCLHKIVYKYFFYICFCLCLRHMEPFRLLFIFYVLVVVIITTFFMTVHDSAQEAKLVPFSNFLDIYW